ncbi:hypothetical protein MSG28_013200 [Choristoneura fumiferana]|uniref:Uncharacterized protein n=1 Tax=Choristoneura fumiferana TaxID=7141 RepID=A0ACC0KT67_CHOFU|nr:hypothetical protein MSG28_013200 [Choristoneura fumiferana]
MSTWLTTSVVPGPILLTIAVALTAAGMDLTLDLCYVRFHLPMYNPKSFATHEISPTFVNPIHTVIKIIGNTPGIIVSYLVGAVIMKFQTSVEVSHCWAKASPMSSTLPVLGRSLTSCEERRPDHPAIDAWVCHAAEVRLTVV